MLRLLSARTRLDLENLFGNMNKMLIHTPLNQPTHLASELSPDKSPIKKNDESLVGKQRLHHVDELKALAEETPKAIPIDELEETVVEKEVDKTVQPESPAKKSSRKRKAPVEEEEEKESDDEDETTTKTRSAILC